MEDSNNNFRWTEELIQQYLDENDYQKLNIRDHLSDTGFAAACEFQPKLAEMMLEKDNIDFNIQNNDGDTGFMNACIHQPELLNKMLENNKIDQNLEDQDGETGYDLAQEHNSKSLEIYQAWLAEQEKNHINTQVQKK